MKKYFIVVDETQVGPFDLNELKARGITSETQVWFEGAKDWTNAGRIKELKGILKIVPPPIKKQVKSSERQKSYLKPILITISLVVLILFAGYLFLENEARKSRTNSLLSNTQSKSSYETKIKSIKDAELESPRRFLNASGTYRENLLGDKLKVKMEITNSATAATFKDVIVRVNYYSKSKTKLASKDYTLYEVFSPKTKRTIDIKIDNYRDVKTIGWDVISAKPFK